MTRPLLALVLALFAAAPVRAAELLTTASCGYNCQGAALIEEDGSHTRMLTSGPWDFDPQWFPEGRRVLYFHRNTSGDFEGVKPKPMVMDTMTGLSREVPVPGSPLVLEGLLSPDGTQLALIVQQPGATELLVQALDGTGQHRVLREDYDGALGSITLIRWSPDSSHLVVQPRGSDRLESVPADGTDALPVQEGEPLPPGFQLPQLSPDGRFLLLQRFNGDFAVFVQDLVTGQVDRPVKAALGAVWQDGRRATLRLSGGSLDDPVFHQSTVDYAVSPPRVTQLPLNAPFGRPRPVPYSIPLAPLGVLADITDAILAPVPSTTPTARSSRVRTPVVTDFGFRSFSLGGVASTRAAIGRRLTNGRCRFLGAIHARKCSDPVFVRTGGPVGWAQRTRALAPGDYVVRLRITDGSGHRSTRRVVVRKA